MARPEALCQRAGLVGLTLVAGLLGPVQAQERAAIAARARVVDPANRQALAALSSGLIQPRSGETLWLAPIVPAAPWASVHSQWGPRSVIPERRRVLLAIIDFPHN